MNHLFSAVRFLTILPIGKAALFEPVKVIPYFPLVGLFIGCVLALSDMIITTGFPISAASALDVIILVMITGAFHIDGLADTADGMYGSRPREKALEIMKDSRIGSIGATTIICVLAVKWSGIYCLNQNRFLFLMIIPAYSRAGMILGIRFLKYGRQEGGLGHDFFSKPLPMSAFFWCIIPFILSFFAGPRAIVLNLSFCVLTASVLMFYDRKMGCITGDMLGAMNEITEAVLFLVCSVGCSAT